MSQQHGTPSESQGSNSGQEKPKLTKGEQQAQDVRDFVTALWRQTAELRKFLPSKLLLGLLLIASAISIGVYDTTTRLIHQPGVPYLLTVGWMIVWLLLAFNIIQEGSRIRQFLALVLLTLVVGYSAIGAMDHFFDGGERGRYELRNGQSMMQAVCDPMLAEAQSKAAQRRVESDRAHKRWNAETDGHGKSGKKGFGTVADELFAEKSRLDKLADSAAVDLESVRGACNAISSTTVTDAQSAFAVAHSVWNRVPEHLRAGVPEPKVTEFVDGNLIHPLLVPYKLLRKGDPMAVAAALFWLAMDLIVLLLGPLVVKRHDESVLHWLTKTVSAILEQFKDLLATIKLRWKIPGTPSPALFRIPDLGAFLAAEQIGLSFFRALLAACDEDSPKISEVLFLNSLGSDETLIIKNQSALKYVLHELHRRGHLLNVALEESQHRGHSTDQSNLSNIGSARRCWTLDQRFYWDILTPWIRHMNTSAVKAAQTADSHEVVGDQLVRVAVGSPH